jgi:hypothetical protein
MLLPGAQDPSNQVYCMHSHGSRNRIVCFCRNQCVGQRVSGNVCASVAAEALLVTGRRVLSAEATVAAIYSGCCYGLNG